MIDKGVIFKTLSDLGLSSNDLVMIHGDAGPAAQLEFRKGENPLTEFFNILCAFFSDGTILVPSFSYSSTKNVVFDPLATKSEVGLFSETFRNYPNVLRSLHPIFSFSVYGAHKEFFLNTTLTDCFGVNTIFDEFYKMNGKIVCIGCGVDRITFVHYVEQQLSAPYRYFKNFEGVVIVDGIKCPVNTRYFVRDQVIDARTDLSLLQAYAMSKNKMAQIALGRFPVLSISACDFYDIAKELYVANKYSLVKQRFINA
jgi:aminoglycoside 3-N-acetyltransferase